jgi:undecaprenyl-diphosphatase
LRAAGPVGEASHKAIASLAVSHLIVQFVKRTVGRPRPSRGVGCTVLAREPDQFSFPSGHSAAAMSVALAYAFVFPQLAPVLVPTAVFVGMSRVCLGVHYPGDVLIGQLIAALTVIGITVV